MSITAPYLNVLQLIQTEAVRRTNNPHDFLAAEGAALEATFKLVNQSKSVMSCNFRHSDILFVCSSQEGDHYDGIQSITF